MNDRRAEMLAALATIGARADMAEDEIRKAYTSAARAHHPDVGGDAETFAKLAAAWRVVKETAEIRTICPVCQGSKVVKKQGRNWQSFTLPCAACNGTGRKH